MRPPLIVERRHTGRRATDQQTPTLHIHTPRARRPLPTVVVLTGIAFLWYTGWAYVSSGPQVAAQPALAPAVALHPLAWWGWAMIASGAGLLAVWSRHLWPVAVATSAFGVYVHLFLTITFYDAWRGPHHVGAIGLAAPAATTVLLAATILGVCAEHWPARWSVQRSKGS